MWKKSFGATDNCFVIKWLGEMMRAIAHLVFFKKYVTIVSLNMDWYICHRQACGSDKVFMEAHLKWLNKLKDRKWNYYHLSLSLCIIFSFFFVSVIGDRKDWWWLGSITHICLLGDYNVVVKMVIKLAVHLKKW